MENRENLIGKRVKEHPMHVGPRGKAAEGVVVGFIGDFIVVQTRNLYGVEARVLLKAVIPV